MRVITFKAKPKTIFGIILLVVGIIVVVLSFVGNHNGVTASASAPKTSCKTKQERVAYINSLGWQCDDSETSKQITIPTDFNDVYENYNSVQKEQGFDLEKYKGKTVTLYTYNITNYENEDNIIADLIVCDDLLIGADLCNPSADNGFLVGLEKNG
jgi:hypothetical protein